MPRGWVCHRQGERPTTHVDPAVLPFWLTALANMWWMILMAASLVVLLFLFGRRNERVVKRD